MDTGGTNPDLALNLQYFTVGVRRQNRTAGATEFCETYCRQIVGIHKIHVAINCLK
jgi:hypothetical protein